jgi:hypothetical protein
LLASSLTVACPQRRKHCTIARPLVGTRERQHLTWTDLNGFARLNQELERPRGVGIGRQVLAGRGLHRFLDQHPPQPGTGGLQVRRQTGAMRRAPDDLGIVDESSRVERRQDRFERTRQRKLVIELGA